MPWEGCGKAYLIHHARAMARIATTGAAAGRANGQAARPAARLRAAAPANKHRVCAGTRQGLHMVGKGPP
jgi:hypothetical protein